MPEEFISRGAALADFEACNAESPRWTPQRVKTLLLRQPAADVAEVVHGRWDISKGPLGDMCKCSACGSLPSLPTKFCPYCGARMDGAAE